MGKLLMECFFRGYIFSDKYKIWIIIVVFFTTFINAYIIYKKDYGLTTNQSLSYAIALYATDVKTPKEIDSIVGSGCELNVSGMLDCKDGVNKFKELNRTKVFNAITEKRDWLAIYSASLCSKFAVFLTIILIYARKILSVVYRFFVRVRGGHTIVVGLGRNSRFFINSMIEREDGKHRIIAFESNKESPYLEKYKDKRVSIVIADVEKMMDNLSLHKCKNIFISTGNDEINIYLAMKLMAYVEESKCLKKFLVHIEDRTLRNLYADGKALHQKEVELKPFSFYKESARKLFREHALDGDDCSLIDSGEAFNILLVGNSELTISLISEACRLSNLPKENKLSIYCMGINMEGLEKRVLYMFPKIEDLRDVEIKYIEANSHNIEFYHESVWGEENLKHVIYADDSVLENIRIASKVSDVTYRTKNSIKEKTKFHIATMNHIKVAQEITKEYQGENVYTFAEADKICSCENLFFNEVDYIAKMIHYTYISDYFRKNDPEINDNKIARLWKEASVNDKRASLAQAIHINTKLKALGLKSQKVDKKINKDDLKKINVTVLESKLEKDLLFFGLTEDKLEEMEKAYSNREDGVEESYFFPRKYKTNLENLLRMEHNRWMSILILMDNIRDDEVKKMKSTRRKQLRVHHLLKPFEEFKTNEERIYVINDLNTIINIAQYMALTGYELLER